MPINPDKHITPEHASFINEVEKLEPVDTGDLYPYVRQAGYHGSRADQLALGRPNDYSIRSADDRAGPDDKTAAFDWISEAARLRNDHTVMYKYGRRIRDAFNRRDPRLHGWREWLTYLDGALIGFDFVGWYTRVPDPSHGMHHHLSKLRRYTTDWASYASMLSILAGEPLEVWTAGRSRYQGEDMSERANQVIEAWASGIDTTPTGPVEPVKWRVRDEQWQAGVNGQLAALATAVQQIAAAVSALGAVAGVNVQALEDAAFRGAQRAERE